VCFYFFVRGEFIVHQILEGFLMNSFIGIVFGSLFFCDGFPFGKKNMLSNERFYQTVIVA
jgi:hypothetical protein